MELSQGAVLSLPLFELNDSLYERDVAQPDLLLEVTLNDELLAHLCQNPSTEASVSVQLTNYTLVAQQHEKPTGEHDAMLILSHGPALSAQLQLNDGPSYVSPQLDMMPTFDLGDEDE